MDSVLQNLNGMNLNVQVPVGYVIAGLMIIGAVFFVIKKAIAITLAVASKVTFASVAASILMITGLTGTGYSIGEFASGKVSDKKDYLSNDELMRLMTHYNIDKDRLTVLLQYAKDRDANMMKVISETPRPIAWNSAPQAQPQEPEYVDYRTPWTLLGSSLAFLIMSILWFVRSNM
jgi:hypothetical protein